MVLRGRGACGNVWRVCWGREGSDGRTRRGGKVDGGGRVERFNVTWASLTLKVKGYLRTKGEEEVDVEEEGEVVMERGDKKEEEE